MTHHEHDASTISSALELLTEHGFEGMASALQLLLDEAMKLERSAWLGAGPYERSPGRRAYANGFKPKRVKSRVGELELSIPKVRGVPEGVAIIGVAVARIQSPRWRRRRHWRCRRPRRYR